MYIQSPICAEADAGLHIAPDGLRSHGDGRERLCGSDTTMHGALGQINIHSIRAACAQTDAVTGVSPPLVGLAISRDTNL